jgi:hypothetical protein
VCWGGMGGSLWQIQIGLYCILIRSPPLAPTCFTKTIARGFFVLFPISYQVHQPYFITFISSIHHPTRSPHSHPHCTYFTVLSLLLISINIQRVFSIHSCHAYTLLWSYQHLPLLFLTSYPPTLHFSTIFNTCSYTFYVHRYVLPNCWCSPSSTKFHRVVPPLQSHSTYKFAYDHVCFYVYVYLLALSS